MATKGTQEGRGLVRFFLVWSSLSPVFLLWSIRGVEAIDDQIWIPICLFLFLCPTVILYLIFRQGQKNQNVKTIEIARSRDQGDHLLTYLFAMLIPLFDVNLGGMRDIVSVVVAFGFVMYLFWYMRLHYMNLFFSMLGYRIYTVEAKVGTTMNEGREGRLGSFVVISKSHLLTDGTFVTGYRLGGNVLVDDADD